MKYKNVTKSQITFCKALGVGIAIGVLFTFLYLAGLFETLELKAIDLRSRRYARRLTPNKDILIVTIDQNSIDYLKNRLDIIWKWPRDVYAHVIQYLDSAGARGILLDFDFSDPDINRAEFEEDETDRLLGNAIREAGTVVNSALFYRISIDRFGNDSVDYTALERFAVDISGGHNLNMEKNSSVVMPIAPIMQHSRGIGATNLYPDRDGITRKARLFQEFRGSIFPSSALSLVLSILNITKIEIGNDRKMKLGDHTIQLNNKGELYINWYGDGGPDSSTYKYIPIADVLLSYIQQKDGLTPTLAPEVFRDKIVLIGSNAPSLYDLKPTPFSGKKAYPGVEIIATVINNLMDGNSLVRVEKKIIISLIFFVCILTSFIVSFVKSVFKNTILTVLLIFGIWYSAFAVFYSNIILDIVPAGTGIFFSFTVVTMINYLTEGKEKRWLKKAFSHYIPASIIAEILQNPEKLKLGGEKRDVTVLFADIRGFTSISETAEPEQVVNILNEYFSPMTEIIFNYNGTLDKYIGDAIMAFFGAPLERLYHQTDACNAALDMIVMLAELKKKWIGRNMPENIQHMNIGIGINSGPVAVGNMGSRSRFDYTVIGDEVNLGSRLEGINKIYGTNIIVSDNTYKFTKDTFIFRDLDYIKVAGKNIPIKIYELIKRKDGSKEDKKLIENSSVFREGLVLYRKQQWDDASRIFNDIYQMDNSNKACEVFIKRISLLRNRDLPENWDGIFEMRRK